MNALSDKIKIESNGDIVKYYRDNTKKMYNLYLEPDNSVKPINISNISIGGFYFLQYYDESNWMKYSPILFVDYKKLDNKIIGYAINFNFIPLEVRSGMLDKVLNDLEDEQQLSWLTFEKAYIMLLKVGYEYALVEYDMKRIMNVYQIDFNILPQFLYSSYPKNKYDPEKLYSIWVKKLETREQRHQEIIQSTVDDFFDVTQNIDDKYTILSRHVKRLQRNIKKFD